MNWLFFNPTQGDSRGDTERWVTGLCQELSLHGDRCLEPPASSDRGPFRAAPDFKPDIIMVTGFHAARLARRSYPDAAIGLHLSRVQAYDDRLFNHRVCNTCVDRILTDNPAVRIILLQRPWILPGKVAVYPPEAMTQTVRSIMQQAWDARRNQCAPVLSTPSGRLGLRSSGPVEMDSPIWNESVESELISRSGHAVVRRLQYGSETLYIKRFLGRRLSLRRLGLRNPLAVDNFRTAAKLILRGAAVVPHFAAGWHLGPGKGDESLLITGTIPGALTLDKWSRLAESRLSGHRGLWRELAVWLAHLHGAGVACHDLKASNILVHQEKDGSLEFILLDLDNCRLRPAHVTDHDIHRNFHQLFRSFQTIANPPAILLFLAVYRHERGLKRRHMRDLMMEVERRLHRRGTGYEELLAVYRAGRNP